jgi:hypothetical protein
VLYQFNVEIRAQSILGAERLAARLVRELDCFPGKDAPLIPWQAASEKGTQ